jgi:two-component system CheB/CheR fusion protein
MKKKVSKSGAAKVLSKKSRWTRLPRPFSATMNEVEPELSKTQASDFSIVGIGASAGGYEAFAQLLEHIPKDTGMAFVLVQHLDPSRESKLTELLARTTPMPVKEAQHGVRIAPNNIYVMPPNADMRLVDGKLMLQTRKTGPVHMPIDLFFRSLAEHQQNRSIGIVLSGMGSDGTFGLQAISGAGGITIAQDETTAKYFGMPGSAMHAGVVDMVLTPEGMARELVRIGRHPYVGGVGKSKRKQKIAAPEPLPSEHDGDLNALFALLRARTTVDFSLYKHSTLQRRIQRRMLLLKIDSLPRYVNHLRTHLADVETLFNDLLLNVTEFFRDPSVFQALKKRIFPRLVKNRRDDAPIRIWVCGCSTGEEAYSMGISLVEFFENARVHPNVQIFATDISESSLEQARLGMYPENISLDVSPERLRRFFVKSNGGYQVSKAIRDMCVFARQNVIVDPPFSNLDLISCRNVLIYMSQPLQKKIMPAFHYALKPEGYLLLGSSEAIGAASDLFALQDKRFKIYSRKTAAYRPGIPMVYHKDSLLRPEFPRHDLVPFKPEGKGPDLQQLIDRMILNKWCPAAVVINSQMDVLMFRGRTGPYLEHAAGSASLNLLKMARESLVLDLRTAISKSIKHDTPIRQDNVPLREGGKIRSVSIEVVPFKLAESTERFYLVLFLESHAEGDALSERKTSRSPKARQDSERRIVTQLRSELASTKESLQAIIEEQEATNEELKSANEEIQSSNEELQSTNEELETAKEELQSTNEELTTLNEELQTRNTELSQLNNDLTNLLSSVNIAIVIVGEDLSIRRFTPMAERIFNLVPSDIGRKLSDLNRNINVPDLDESIRQVVDSLANVDREVQDREARWYSLRIRPYRTGDNKIEGAVLLLLDITELKRAVELFMSAIKQPLIALQTDLRVKSANPAFYELFQLAPEETEGKFIHELEHNGWVSPKLKAALLEVASTQEPLDDFRVETEIPKIGLRQICVDARPFAEDGRPTRLIVVSIRDLTPVAGK